MVVNQHAIQATLFLVVPRPAESFLSFDHIVEELHGIDSRCKSLPADWMSIGRERSRMGAENDFQERRCFGAWADLDNGQRKGNEVGEGAQQGIDAESSLRQNAPRPNGNQDRLKIKITEIGKSWSDGQKSSESPLAFRHLWSTGFSFPTKPRERRCSDNPPANLYPTSPSTRHRC